MEKLIKYRTADLMLFDDYDEALKHEEYLNTNIKEATDKIKFYKNSKEILVTVDNSKPDLAAYIDLFDTAYSLCDKIAILDTLSDTVRKYIMDFHSLDFPSAPGVYKLNEDCDWELVK